MLRIGFAFVVAPRVSVGVLVCFLLQIAQPFSLQAQDEFRGFWVDAFHAGFKNSAQVSTLISNVRDANCNAVVVQIRKRGDAYYTPDTGYPDYEPHATDTSPANFDALADLIAKAHDTSGGKRRIEVHAWLVTWPIWNNTAAPSNPQHPYNRHPEWLTQDAAGATWNNQNYCFDPGHPGAFEHTYRIAINLVTNYDVDGINFDYVRHAGNIWGYNPTAVNRFHAQYGGSGLPSNTDPAWLQFRRDQITAFMRKVYLNTIAVKRHVKISADTITWAPGPASLSDWYLSARALKDVLQDWRSWMQEGIMDLNIPMTYFDQSGAYTRDWTNWCNFVRDHQYGRHAAVGPGTYLNATADALTQLRHTRLPSPSGNRARGLCNYSYAVPDKSGTPFATFLTYLTSSPNAYDPVSPGIFAQPAAIPPMPWKTAPTQGHIMGTIFAGMSGNIVDGAVATVSGPASRAQTNDGTGFLGFVDLPPGTYAVRARMPGMGAVTNLVTVSAGVVTNLTLRLSTADWTSPEISGVQASAADNSATIVWTTDENSDSRVEYGLTASYGSIITNSSLTRSHAVNLPGLIPATMYHFRVRSRDAARNDAVSADFTFTTNPSGVVQDIIIDNPAASVTGTWSTGTSAADRYGADYRFKSQGSGTSYLQYTPAIVTPGPYDVYEWHSVGGNRTTNAPFVVQYNGGSRTAYINQELSGGTWNLVGRYSFASGTGGYIRITDGFPDAGQVVIADAVKLVYVPAASAPSITAHPQDQSVKTSSNVTFTVSATGTAPLSYQWFFKGNSIPAATATAYTRVNVQTNDAGGYHVVVTNSAGSAASSSALLTVIPLQPPVILAQPQSRAAVPGGSAVFSVSGSSSSPLTYQWRFNDQDLSNQANPTLLLSELKAADFGTYTVLLSNSDGSVLSDPAVLRLATPPHLAAVLLNGTNFSIGFNTELGPAYILEFNSLLFGDSWQSLTNVAGNGAPVSITNPLTLDPVRLYRLRLQ